MPIILDDKMRQFMPHVFETEEEFEKVVVRLSDQIFGPESIYLDIKKRIKGNDIISIPDGYLIDLTEPAHPALYVVENEIVKHDAFKHIGIQMLRFITSFEEAKADIRRILMAEIQKSPVALQRLEAGCKASDHRNIDSYLDEAVFSEFKGLVLIDEARLELNRVLEKIRASLSVLEVKAYRSEDGTLVYQYDTLYDEEEPPYVENETPSRTREARSARRDRRAKCDTIVVPAREDGFKQVFLGEDRWYAIRIGAAMKDRVKYIAAYQVAPVSAITHIAEVKEIRPFGDSGKYEVIFKGPAKPIRPLPLKGGKSGQPQGPVYVERERLLSGESIEDILAA